MTLVYPMLAQMALTFVLMWIAGIARYKSAMSGKVHLRDVRLSNDAWPDRIRQLGNAMDNQFQTPTLFYALCLLAMMMDVAGSLMVAAAWLYIASRFAHAFVHTHGNRQPMRFLLFGAGTLALMAMAMLIAVAAAMSG